MLMSASHTHGFMTGTVPYLSKNSPLRPLYLFDIIFIILGILIPQVIHFSLYTVTVGKYPLP